MARREYDILIIGASGFAGTFCTSAFAGNQNAFASLNLPKNLLPDANIKYAIMGRSQEKLEALAKKCGCTDTVGIVPVPNPDTDYDSVTTAVARATLVLDTLSDHASKARENVAKACAEVGTHLLSLSGMWDGISGNYELANELDKKARETNVLLSPWVGWITVPYEQMVGVGLNYVQKQRKDGNARKIKHILCYTMMTTGKGATEQHTLPEKVRHTLGTDIKCARPMFASVNTHVITKVVEHLNIGTNDFKFEEFSPSTVAMLDSVHSVRDFNQRKLYKWDCIIKLLMDDGQSVMVSLKDGNDCMYEETISYLVASSLYLIKNQDKCVAGINYSLDGLGDGLLVEMKKYGLPTIQVVDENITLYQFVKNVLDGYQNNEMAKI